MGKIGLIAGAGSIPVEFVKAVKAKGDKCIVFALNGMASSRLEQEADKVYWLDIGEYKKFAFLLLKEMIRKIALLGKVEKKVIYASTNNDIEYDDTLNKMDNKKDYSILKEVTKHLSKIGVEVISGTEYLSHLLCAKGMITEACPNSNVQRDIIFAQEMAKKIAEMDIGQTVIVKDQSVVAVEAMEGTDSAIERAYGIAGEGCVMVKVSRPKQDMRWDVPTIGPDTIKKLIDNKFSGLAFENSRMFLLEKELVKEMADSANLTVEVI